MRKMTAMTLLGITILCSGCVRSLHPIFTEQDIVFEPRLVGRWAEDNSKEIWDFARKDAISYTLIHTDDKGRQGRFIAHLAKLDGNLFLDLFPEDLASKENDLLAFHFLPVHTFLSVSQIEPILQMRAPDNGWLKKHLAENPGAIRHDRIKDDEILLAASTNDLQAFWLKHLKTKDAFGDSSDMHRLTSATTEEKANRPYAGDGNQPRPTETVD